MAVWALRGGGDLSFRRDPTLTLYSPRVGLERGGETDTPAADAGAGMLCGIEEAGLGVSHARLASSQLGERTSADSMATIHRLPHALERRWTTPPSQNSPCRGGAGRRLPLQFPTVVEYGT